MPAVSVIVPARDVEATLPRTLSGLLAQDFPGDWELLVVDDGSDDATAAVVRRLAPAARLLHTARVGPAGARNAGAREARAERLAFCDADVVPEPGWLSAGVAALDGLELAQGLVLPDPDATLRPFDRTIWVTGTSALYEAASLFVDRATFESVGGFEQWLRPRRGKDLAEDVWFGWRVARTGAQCGFVPEARATHAVFPRTWRGYVAERTRLAYFPAMVRQIPELRAAFLHRSVFLNRRTAHLDLALAGAATAVLLRRTLPLIATGPYLRTLLTEGRRGAGSAGGPAPAGVVAADVLADLVGLQALLRGSARYRALVI